MKLEHTKEISVVKQTSLLALAVVSVVAIVTITICYLSSNGFNSQISADKEKIEVTTENSYSNSTNITR